ncbi:alpha/beta hydrolase [uncultured Algibacter sp.]|uniref:alpha/beta fold hydrolase n=1 Tax=uncultured Algibacter sp. TaxID=298659 RepID=UPI0026219E64|nr:alpha/beta hydrolase [uncultured Algibacter sp.]
MKLVIAKITGFFINIIAYISPNYAARLAINLFSTPRKGKLTEEATNFLNSAFQEDVTFKNSSIMTYRWLGDKETILLVHGWESNSFRWKDLIESLKSQGFHVIALDAPAHGKSGGKSFNVIDYAECIYLVAKKFKVNIIVGHSLGGMAAVLFQYKYKLPNLRRIALLGAPSNYEGVFNRYINMMSYHKPLVKSINDFALKRFGNLPEYYDTAMFSNELNAKGLIIHDLGDNIIPYEDALDYSKNFREAKLISTKNHDHSLKSEEIDKYIIEFITD